VKALGTWRIGFGGCVLLILLDMAITSARIATLGARAIWNVGRQQVRQSGKPGRDPDVEAFEFIFA